MKKIILFISLFTFLSVGNAFENHQEFNKKILKSIEKFKINPIGDKSIPIIKEIIEFTKNSDTVSVKIYPNLFPVNTNASETSYDFKLFGAFIIGNIEYQLKNNLKINRGKEGAEMLYFVYKKIRKVDSKFKIPNIYNWVRKERQTQKENI